MATSTDMAHLSPPRPAGDLGEAGPARRLSPAQLADEDRRARLRLAGPVAFPTGPQDAPGGSRSDRPAREGSRARRREIEAPGAWQTALEARQAFVGHLRLQVRERGLEWEDTCELLLRAPHEVGPWSLRRLAQYLTGYGRRMPREWRAEVVRIAALRQDRQGRQWRGCDRLLGRALAATEDRLRSLRIEVARRRHQRISQLARRYHETVARLVVSGRGALQEGEGTHEQTSWHEYSRAYHRKNGPTRWQDAGYDCVVLPVGGERTVVVRLFPVRGSAAGSGTIYLSYEAWRTRQAIVPLTPDSEVPL